MTRLCSQPPIHPRGCSAWRRAAANPKRSQRLMQYTVTSIICSHLYCPDVRRDRSRLRPTAGPIHKWRRLISRPDCARRSSPVEGRRSTSHLRQAQGRAYRDQRSGGNAERRAFRSGQTHGVKRSSSGRRARVDQSVGRGRIQRVAWRARVQCRAPRAPRRCSARSCG